MEHGEVLALVPTLRWISIWAAVTLSFRRWSALITHSNTGRCSRCVLPKLRRFQNGLHHGYFARLPISRRVSPAKPKTCLQTLTPGPDQRTVTDLANRCPI